MSEGLAHNLRSLIDQNPNRRIEATAARAELSRSTGRLIAAVEFEKAVDFLKAGQSRDNALSDRRTRSGRWLSLYTPKDEKGLYQPASEYLQAWLDRGEHGLKGVKAAGVVETWNKGDDSRPRPDLMVWIVTGDDISRRVDFISFEVKPTGASALEATTQANGQRTYVSFAYLMQQTSACDASPDKSADYEASCRDHGLGLILFTGDAPGYEDFRIVLRATRNENPRDARSFAEARMDLQILDRALGVVDDER